MDFQSLMITFDLCVKWIRVFQGTSEALAGGNS